MVNLVTRVYSSGESYHCVNTGRGKGSGIATGGSSAPLDSEKFAKNWEKEGENQEKQEKEGKNQEKEEKSGKRGKIGKVLSLCPS